MYKIYQIGNNESLDDVALKINSTTDELKKINGIKDNMVLLPGTYIIIPSTNNKFKTYKAIKGDTLYDIAKRNNVDVNLLLKINGLNSSDYIYPNQEIIIPSNEYKYYITKKDETVNKILDELKINCIELLKNNDLYLVEDQVISYK